MECREWPELLAFLLGGRTHKSRPIILCWNKSDTDTALENKKKRRTEKINDWSQGTNTSFKVEPCVSGEQCIQ